MLSIFGLDQGAEPISGEKNYPVKSLALVAGKDYFVFILLFFI